MRILYVVDKFPKLSESFVLNEIYELCSRGYEVSIFSIFRPDEEIHHKEINEININIKYGKRPNFSSLPDLLTSEVMNTTVLSKGIFLDNPLYVAYWLHLSQQITQFIKSIGGIDHIHSHFAVPTRLAAAYSASYLGVSSTVTAHAFEVFAPDSRTRLKRVLRAHDHVIVPSYYNKSYIEDNFSLKANITVIPATMNVEKFEPTSKYVSGRVLTVARLVEKKGHEYAIDAVAQLVEQGYDVEYHIVGKGEREEFLRERVRERGIEDYVEFLGHVSDERLEKELQDAEIFVLPCVIASDGDRDAAPVALKEAMATKTACISTTISAVPELITDGYDGCLVESRNSEALAESVATLLDNPDRRQKLAENARKTVEEKFNIKSAVDDLIDVFQSVEH